VTRMFCDFCGGEMGAREPRATVTIPKVMYKALRSGREVVAELSGMEDLLTPHDVAKLAGVTPAAVRSWADVGRLPVMRTVSGMRLFLRRDVDRYLEERRAECTQSLASR
jgi:predicted transcriptional regulator